MKNRVLAITKTGEITYCTAPPELRGVGRCNHIQHQLAGENPKEFIKRTSDLQFHLIKKTINKKERFIPLNGTEVEFKPYRMSDEEKENYLKIENKTQLDQNIDGGYIELDEPLWNDMDKNYFSKITGIKKREINSILFEEEYLAFYDDKIKIMDLKHKELLEKNGIEHGTGLEYLNKIAKEKYNWEATKDVYVLPYYLRQGLEVDGIDSDLTSSYKYLLRANNSKAKNKQLAYEYLLNNGDLKDKGKFYKGYKIKSLSDEFAGKGGIFRAYLSGSSIPYGGRAVITPSKDVEYGEVKIPPYMAVDIYKPTIIKQLVMENKTEKEIDIYFNKFKGEQSKVLEEDLIDLEKRIKNKRVIMNRQPSLHSASLQSFIPKISNNPTVQINPLYCKNYGADFDGDCVSIFAINNEDMGKVADETINSKLEENTKVPRNKDKSAILPNKEALWGLLNILEKRS